MESLLVKAKRKDNNEWVIGYYVWFERSNGHYIYSNEKRGTIVYAVLPETICRNTGLVDTNGKSIYENDIVAFEDTGEDGYEYKEGFDFQNRAKVVFKKGRWELSDFLSNNSCVLEEMNNHEELFCLWDYVEVIGNIFDNADLLEG